MKIGILSQPLGHNYGGTLQNYALHRVLKKLGHEPVTLKYDIITYRELSVLYLAYIYRLITCNPLKKNINLPSKIKVQENNFREFERKYINIEYCGRSRIHPSKIRVKDFKAFIVGSDQVWRPDYNPGPLLYNMFLDFVNGNDIKRISYAASFGSDLWSLNPYQTDKCKELIHKFNAVSVREITGVQLCKEHFDIDAVNVLDPTMLLTQNEYNEIINEPKENKYCIIYLLDPYDKKYIFINEFCKKHKLKLINLMERDSEGVWMKIEDWLGYIKYADFVFTDSFHGMVFSILFRRPFYNFGNKWRGNSRINSLCKLLDLQHCVIDVNEIKSDHHNFPSINWNSVDSTLVRMRKESIEFLKKNLY